MLLVAGRLSLLGAKRILATAPSSPLARRRQRALLSQHGSQLQLHQVRGWGRGRVQDLRQDLSQDLSQAEARRLLEEAARMGPLHAVLLIAVSTEYRVQSTPYTAHRTPQ